MEPLDFSFTGSPAKIRFARGARHETAAMIEALGCKRALVLSTEPQKEAAETLACDLGKLCLGVYANATMHTPVSVTEAAMEVVAESRVDCLISFGGGSTIGLGKAIALRTDLPQIAIPTTYAGSEVTSILGQTEDGKKTTLRSPKVLPEVVLYDPELTLTLPVAMSVTSGINALAHGIEALYAVDRNPISTMMAAEGARALIQALPKLVQQPDDMAAREQALYGSWLSGAVLGQVSMALHHKLCHTLGGSFDLPHAHTHTVVLPYAAAYNAAARPDLLAPVAEELGADQIGSGLKAFAEKLNAPLSLAALGMPQDGIAKAVDMALASPYPNPRPLERDGIARLIEAAYHGSPPEG